MIRKGHARRWGAVLGLTGLAAMLVASVAGAQCSIGGPVEVSSNQSFTLCGPSGSGYTYEWYGPGLTTMTNARCITIRPAAAGTYEYELTTWWNGRDPRRCTHVVRVIEAGSSAEGDCSIEGPSVINTGSIAQLCGPSWSFHSFRWTGPGGFTATTRCISTSREGMYELTIRNALNGATRRCTHRLQVGDQWDEGGSTTSGCAITGPRYLPSSGGARLCADSYSGATYRWDGPGVYEASGRCVTATRAGTYTVTIEDLDGRELRRCSFSLGSSGGYDTEEPDAALEENCPRDLSFWSREITLAGNRGVLSNRELRDIARCVDERSSYFNWSNDMAGLRAALTPSRPITYRKNLAREYAALLANVCSGRLDVSVGGDAAVGLNENTTVQFAGGSSTVADVIAEADQLLRSSRGNFRATANLLARINRGRGIGPVCR